MIDRHDSKWSHNVYVARKSPLIGMHDLDDDPTTGSTYECLGCGNLVTADSHPGTCDDCGGGFQNRAMSLE